MIRINLLDSKKREGTKERPVVFVLGTLIPSFIIVLAVFLVLMFLQMGKEKRANELHRQELAVQEEVEILRPEVALSRSQIEELEYKKSVIELLMGKERMSWMENLRMIAHVIPDNVYMYRLQLTEIIDRRRTADTEPRVAAFVPTNLRMEGFAKAEDEVKELQLISSFIDSLEEDSLFQRNFHSDIRFSSSEKVSVANKVVSLFVLNLTPRSGDK